MDLDDFKHINDTFGHSVGDTVLKAFANILDTHTRQGDLCARWGGEEFVLAALNTNLEQANIIANKIRISLEESSKINHLLSKSITVTIGITKYKKDESLDSFISRADNAMYLAKSKGKNQVLIS